MPAPLTLELTAEQRQQLLLLRDRGEKPYLRERAAALLKIADGVRHDAVASTGLLRRRCRQTVAQWLHRFQLEGESGLSIRNGRGRKPAFPPSSF